MPKNAKVTRNLHNIGRLGAQCQHWAGAGVVVEFHIAETVISAPGAPSTTRRSAVLASSFSVVHA